MPVVIVLGQGIVNIVPHVVVIQIIQVVMVEVISMVMVRQIAAHSGMMVSLR